MGFREWRESWASKTDGLGSHSRRVAAHFLWNIWFYIGHIYVVYIAGKEMNDVTTLRTKSSVVVGCVF